MTVFDKKSVREVAAVSNKFRILEKTSPTLHSSFIIRHSSFIIFSISTSPKFLRSPFFQTAKLLRNQKFSGNFPDPLARGYNSNMLKIRQRFAGNPAARFPPLGFPAVYELAVDLRPSAQFEINQE